MIYHAPLERLKSDPLNACLTSYYQQQPQQQLLEHQVQQQQQSQLLQLTDLILQPLNLSAHQGIIS